MELTQIIPIFFLAVGLGIGILSGMIGIGGGLLTIPALLFLYPYLWPDHPGFVDFTMKTVTGVAATLSLGTSLTAVRSHHQRDNLNWPLIWFMGIGCLIGAYLGGVSSNYFSEGLLKVIYVVLLVIMIAIQYRQEALRKNDPAIESNVTWAFEPKSNGLVTIVSLVIGYSSGLLGVGGAVFILPFIHYFLKVPLRLAIGCTTGIVVLTCLASFGGKLQEGLIPMPEALIITFGAMIGAYLGVKISFKTPEKVLKSIFLSLLWLMLIKMTTELLGWG